MKKPAHGGLGQYWRRRRADNHPTSIGFQGSKPVNGPNHGPTFYRPAVATHHQPTGRIPLDLAGDWPPDSLTG